MKWNANSFIQDLKPGLLILFPTRIIIMLSAHHCSICCICEENWIPIRITEKQRNYWSYCQEEWMAEYSRWNNLYLYSFISYWVEVVVKSMKDILIITFNIPIRYKFNVVFPLVIYHFYILYFQYHHTFWSVSSLVLTPENTLLNTFYFKVKIKQTDEVTHFFCLPWYIIYY